MSTFAERLKQVMDRQGLSQAEAASRCGISQQSINYIIKKNVETSKLAVKIAEGLKVNPDWLIYGKGRIEELTVHEVPIIHSVYMLKKFMLNKLKEEAFENTAIDRYLGHEAFAYMWNLKEMLICFDKSMNITAYEYLTVRESSTLITTSEEEMSFPIFEWRIRYEDF